MFSVLGVYFFFFFNDTATTEIYTLSLHDALPISCSLSMARDWLVSWVTFSSTVMRCTRSAARCSAGKAGFRYGGGSEFWACARLAIRRTTIAARILKFDDRMYECASICFLQFAGLKIDSA